MLKQFRNTANQLNQNIAIQYNTNVFALFPKIHMTIRQTIDGTEQQDLKDLLKVLT